jgi:hypothetical protein
VDLALKAQVLDAGGLAVDARALADAADRPPHGARIAQHVVARDAGGAGVGPRQRGEDPDGGGLAGAVGAEQAEDRARGHG